MKPLVAVFSLIFLACNIALANGPALSYCIEKSTGEVCNVATAKATEESEKCCPFEQARKLSSVPLPFECDHCTDYEVEASDEEIAPSFDRTLVKAAIVVGIVPTDLFAICSELRSIKNLDTRAPPNVFPKASQQYAETIQLRI